MNNAPPKASGGKLRLPRAGHDPRAAALLVLHRVLEEGEDSQAALNRTLAEGAFSIAPSDRGLCTELVYGCLRNRLRLQPFALSFLKRPDKLPREMCLTIDLALYEMTFLRTPHRAVVHWAVEHTGNRFGKGLASVANGALRSMQRNLGRLRAALDADPSTLEGDALAERLGAPPWLLRLWSDAYGRDAAVSLLSAALTAAPSGLRLNRRAPAWKEVRNELLATAAAPPGGMAHTISPGTAAPEDGASPPCAETPGVPAQRELAPGQALPVGEAALAFGGPLPPAARMLTRRGALSRQSAAACEALEAMRPDAWPLPIWDCCAGRGGKTLALLECGLPVALASDISAARLRGLLREAARLGLTPPPCAVYDAATSAAEWPPTAFLPFDEDATRSAFENATDALRINGNYLDCNEKKSEVAPSSEEPKPVTSLMCTADAHAAAGRKDHRNACAGSGERASGKGSPPEPPAAVPALFGSVLLDAPCSGLGTLSRRPEIRLRRTPDDFVRLVSTQRRLLDAIWARLAPGALLIYMTCTLNPDENEGQVAAFLSRHPDAGDDGSFQTPFTSPLREFFFAARLRKKA